MARFISKLDFLQFSFERASHENEELGETWRLLDSKAQATATIAGVFIAALFVFIAQAGRPPLGTAKWLVVLGVLSCVGSIYFAVRSMAMQSVGVPMTAAEVMEDIEGLAASPLQYNLRYEALLVDSIDSCIAVNGEIQIVNDAKASRLKRAHFALSVAMVASGTAAIFVLLS